MINTYSLAEAIVDYTLVFINFENTVKEGWLAKNNLIYSKILSVNL